MKGNIKVGYGGSDSSCKNIRIEGTDLTVSDLLSMLQKAQELNIYNVCIQKFQFNSLIENIKNIIK